MTSLVKPLHDYVFDSFSDAGVKEFLLPIRFSEIFTFISQQIVSIFATAPNNMTVLVDHETAATTNLLAELGHADHIYVLQSGDTDLPNLTQQTSLIDDCPVEANDRLIVIIGPTTSFLITFAHSPIRDIDPDASQGYWSFHREAVFGVARFLTGSTALEFPDQRADEKSYPISSSAIHLVSNLEDFIGNQQNDTIALKDDLSLILDILKSLSVRRSTHEILYLFVEKIAATVQADRCSVVRIWEGSDEGHVLASHEDSSVNNMVIDLHKYPEIRNTLETSEKTLVNDPSTDPIVADVAGQLHELGVTGILVVPIVLFDPKVGTFLLRIVRKGGTFSQREVEFCHIVSETAANAIERADLFETIQKTNRSLERLATTDPLTGLYNRRYFIGHLEDEIERAVRYKIPTACILIDIDDFKSINDTYGHLEGDEVLRDVSKRTLDSARGTDIVARYGGEEFIILLPQTNTEGATKHAERLLKIVSETPYKSLPEDLVITISVGISLHNSNDEITADEFIKKADIALYEAKRTGKNKLVIHQD